nr:uncharacterized protein LOC124814682 isoform X2 [Hydra vulgaris]
MFSDMVLEDEMIVALPNPCEIVVRVNETSFQRIITYEPSFLQMLNSVPIYSLESSGNSPGTSKGSPQSFILHPQSKNVHATVQSPLSLEIGVKLPIFSIDSTNYLNGLVPCRKHTLKDIGTELAHHLQGCFPDGTPSIRKKFYRNVTLLLKQSYPNCTFGEEGASSVVKRVSNVIRKRRERKIKSLAKSMNANRKLNIAGMNDASFDDGMQCALVQRVPDIEHIRCLVRNMRCSLPYLEHKDHLFYLEIIMDEFERMNIITKESALDKLMQVVEKLYLGMPIVSALIKFHNNTTRRGVLCPVVIAGTEDISF